MMKDKDGNPLTLANVTPEMIQRVYSGKKGCMCGCLGKYYVNPAHRAQADKDRGYPHDDSDISMRMVKRVLNILKKSERAIIEDTYVCIPRIDDNEREYVAYINIPS